jgi:hypothetical protein
MKYFDVFFKVCILSLLFGIVSGIFTLNKSFNDFEFSFECPSYRSRPVGLRRPFSDRSDLSRLLIDDEDD